MGGIENVKIKIEKFNYMFISFVYWVWDKYYFNCFEKVYFYISLLFYEVFMIVFEYVVLYLLWWFGFIILNRF